MTAHSESSDYPTYEDLFLLHGDNHLGMGWTKSKANADLRHDTMLDGLLSSRTMKSMTLRAVTCWYFFEKAAVSSLIDSSPRQPCSAMSALCGSSAVW